MAARLVQEMSLDASGVKQGAQQGSQAIKSMAKTGDEAASSVEQFEQKMASAIASTGNYKKALREATAEVQNLTLAYAQLSAEDKNSDFGRALAQRLDEAKVKAANLKDAIGDTNRDIANLASDTTSLDGFVTGLQAVRDGTAAWIAMTGMNEKEQKKLESVVKQVSQSILTMNALISLYNAVQKGSALYTLASTVALKAKSLAFYAACIATKTFTVSEVAATVATRALAVAVNMLPFVGLITAITGAIAALTWWVTSTEDENEALAKQQEELKKTQEAAKKYYETVGQKAADLRMQYVKLKDEWNKLKSAKEKQKFLEDNASAFKQLGLNVKNVVDAENVFVRNTNQVVAALQLRARAMALEQKMMSAYDKYYTKDEELSTYKRKVWKKGDEVDNQTMAKAGLKYNNLSWGGTTTITTQKQIDALNKYEFDKAKKLNQDKRTLNKKELDDELAYVTKQMNQVVNAQKRLNLGSLITTGTGSGSGPVKTTSGGKSTSKTTKKEEPLPGSIPALQKKRQELDESIRSETYKKTGKTIDEVRKEISDLTVEITTKQLEFRMDVDPAKLELHELEQVYDKTYARIRSASEKDPVKIAYDEQALRKLNQLIVDKKYKLYMDTQPAEDSLEALYKKKDELLNRIAVPDVETGQFKEMTQAYQQLVDRIAQKKLEIHADTSDAADSIDALQSAILGLVLQRYNLQINANTDEARKQVADLSLTIQEMQAELLKKQAQNGVNTTSSAPAMPSLAAMQQRKSALEEGLRLSVDISDEDLVHVKAEIEKLKKDIESREIELGLKEDPLKKAQQAATKRVAQTEQNMQSGGQSSFQKAISTTEKPPTEKDYEAQLSAIQKKMDMNDQYLKILEDEKAKLEELGDTGSAAYEDIKQKIDETTAAQEELGRAAQKNAKNDKKDKKRAKNWEDATDALSDFGSALGDIGKSSDTPELEVAGVIAQSLANLALGASKAISEASSMGPWAWIAFGAMAMAQLASMVAQVHSLTGFASGGIVGGNSYSGDRQLVRVNSGEMILTGQQQANLFNLLNSSLLPGTGGVGGDVHFVLRGTDLYGSLRNLGKQKSKLGKDIGIH